MSMDLLDEYRTLLASIADAQRELAAADQALISKEEPLDGAPVCARCRRPLPPEAPFCQFCGAPTGQPPAEAAPKVWGLLVPGREALVPLEGALLIGRAVQCDLRLDDGKVSRQHARIERRDQACWITDLGSSNGVLVNGRRIQQPLRLGPGDEIQIGDTRLTAMAPPPDQAIDVTLIHSAGRADAAPAPVPSPLPPAAQLPPAAPEPPGSSHPTPPPAQRAARCRQCGQPVSSRALFCAACGAPVKE